MIASRRFGALPAALLAALGTAVLAAILIGLRSIANPGSFRVRASWLMTAQGTSAALAILAAAWIVWGTGRLTTRMAVSACWLMVVVLIWQLLPTMSRWFGTRTEQQLLAFGTWLGAIGLCAAARRFGIRIIDRADHPLASDPRSRQMSLLGLLALMSGVAVILGLLRRLMPQGGIDWSPSGDDVFRLIAQISASLLVASTIITCFHVPRSLWLNLLLVSIFVPVIAVLHLVAYGQTYRMYLYPPDFRIQVRTAHYLALTLWLLAAVGLLRACGLRLRQLRSATEPIPTARFQSAKTAAD
jgi:hypothetical protein